RPAAPGPSAGVLLPGASRATASRDRRRVLAVGDRSLTRGTRVAVRPRPSRPATDRTRHRWQLDEPARPARGAAEDPRRHRALSTSAPAQTVRHARDALRRLVTWMVQAHPEITSLADLHRQHAEEFLRWLGTQTNQQT